MSEFNLSKEREQLFLQYSCWKNMLPDDWLIVKHHIEKLEEEFIVRLKEDVSYELHGDLSNLDFIRAINKRAGEKLIVPQDNNSSEKNVLLPQNPEGVDSPHGIWLPHGSLLNKRNAGVDSPQELEKSDLVKPAGVDSPQEIKKIFLTDTPVGTSKDVCEADKEFPQELEGEFKPKGCGKCFICKPEGVDSLDLKRDGNLKTSKLKTGNSKDEPYESTLLDDKEGGLKPSQTDTSKDVCECGDDIS